MRRAKLGIVDTTFARVDMAEFAIDEIKSKYENSVEIIRRTVPGVKDLAVECKLLLELEKCDSVLALGMVGREPIDTQCAHEASLSIMQAKLVTNRHIVEAFVHEAEARSDADLLSICENRARKHAVNAVLLATDAKSLTNLAGMGVRQGKHDEGRLVTGTKDEKRLGIVVSEFNKEISDEMFERATNVAKKRSFTIARTLRVRGSYDSPLAVKMLLKDRSIDAVVVFGAIITGETKHDELIAHQLARALCELSLEYEKPVALGVSGPGISRKQAKARAKDYAERAVLAADALLGCTSGAV